MKPPREPKAWRYPRWYCVFRDDGSDDQIAWGYGLRRIRIIYPDGRSEWEAGACLEWAAAAAWAAAADGALTLRRDLIFKGLAMLDDERAKAGK